MLLSEAAQSMNGILHGADNSFDRVNTDTRNLTKGDLYFALKGEHFDGHDFLVAAEQKQAIAVVVEQYTHLLALPQIVVSDVGRAMGFLACTWRKNFKGKVIGITGSSGKTTVKGLLRSIFAQRTSVHATPGNWNNHVGVPLTLFGLTDQAFAVVEMGTNHPGEIAYLANMVLPDVALVNNVMGAHIENFGSQDLIGAEKCKIYSMLRGDQTAVINLDDPYSELMLERTSFCIRQGFSATAAEAGIECIYADAVGRNKEGCAQFDLHVGAHVVPVILSIPGLHNLSNALAAAACAVAVGQGPEDIARGLAQYGGDTGRMQIKKSAAGAVVVDDTYNAHPGSMRAAIDYLATCSGQRILVIGDMGELGDTADSAHAEVGDYARQQNIQQLFSVGEKSVLAAQSFGPEARAFDSQTELIAHVRSILNPQATVLVKGSRSAQMERVVAALCTEEQALC